MDNEVICYPNIQNAEYYMSYEQLNEMFTQLRSSIEEEYKGEKEFLDKNLSIILAALTSREDTRQKRAYKENYELWENIISNPSQGALDHIKVTLQGKVLGTVYLMCSVGFFYEMGQVFSAPITPETAIPLAVSAAGTVGALVAFLQVVNTLEDDDFCIYMQALTHFRKHKKFSVDEMLEWFPHGDNRVCNMHNSDWQCDYWDRETDLCNMCWDEENSRETQAKVQNAIDNLTNNKKLLIREKIDGKYFYRFCI